MFFYYINPKFQVQNQDFAFYHPRLLLVLLFENPVSTGFFTANLAAFLTVTRMIVPPSDFDDLYYRTFRLRDDRYKFGSIKVRDVNTIC